MNRCMQEAGARQGGWLVLLAVLSFALCGQITRAQITSPSSSHLPESPIGDDRNDEDWNGRKELQEKLQRTREKERQRRMVDDANRLVELTALYRKSVQEHSAPTADDQKLLAQIEKLAREVKDRMRGM